MTSLPEDPQGDLAPPAQEAQQALVGHIIEEYEQQLAEARAEAAWEADRGSAINHEKNRLEEELRRLKADIRAALADPSPLSQWIAQLITTMERLGKE